MKVPLNSSTLKNIWQICVQGSNLLRLSVRVQGSNLLRLSVRVQGSNLLRLSVRVQGSNLLRLSVRVQGSNLLRLSVRVQGSNLLRLSSDRLLLFCVLQKYRHHDEDSSPQEQSSPQLTEEAGGAELVQVAEKNLSQIENVHGYVTHAHISPMKVASLECIYDGQHLPELPSPTSSTLYPHGEDSPLPSCSSNPYPPIQVNKPFPPPYPTCCHSNLKLHYPLTSAVYISQYFHLHFETLTL
nr:uncharacterized protein LOC114917847 [Labrus bergylta]